MADVLDCRIDFCEGDRVKAPLIGKIGKATVIVVEEDFLVLQFDKLGFKFEMYEKYELYQLFTAESVHMIEKI